MSKVICDICGTAYPESASNCPVCGSSREYALGALDDDIFPDETLAEAPQVKKKSREIFDFDEVNQEEPDDFDEEIEEEEEYEESGTNVGLVIFLVILIVLLLLAAGFFFVRYLMPGASDVPETEPVATQAVILQTEPVETEAQGIPCTNLMMDGGKMELGKDGKKLLNVRVYPEDTTDTVSYISGDENIVTVTEDGTVTAVGEGQTVITVKCGTQQIKCNVIVDYSAEEETVPAGTIPALQVEGEETGTTEEGTENTDPTEAATEGTEATEPHETTEATEATTPADAVLKLKKTDITISFLRTSVTLELDCDINPKDVTWFTMDSSIAIVNDGVVTSIGRGTTKVYAQYKDQQVACIVRCN